MERIHPGEPSQALSSLSLLLAVLTFLSMWGGMTLLLSVPGGLYLSNGVSSPRAMLVHLLLFWIPTATGALACLSGLVGLTAQGHNLELRRRALVSVCLGLAPACLAAAWLAWMLLRSL